MQSHRVVANGLEQHLLEWEPSPERELQGTAVLLHGYMDAAGTWDLVAPALAAAGLRVLAPDMRGFGDGPRAPSGSYYHFPDYVADLTAILDQLRPDPLYLVGHSMGGNIASLYAGTFPERVTRLALLEGVGPPDHAWEIVPARMHAWLTNMRDFEARSKKERAIGTKDDALRRLVLNHPNVPPDILRTRLPHLTRELPGDSGAVTWRFDPLHKTTSPTPFFSESYMAFARRVTCPVLFVGGGALGYHPPDEDARVAAFSRVTREDIEGAGHMMHWTEPARLADILLRFWRGA